MVERNYNLIELGPWGTAKSFVYRVSSPNAILISGGRVTVAQLFVHMGTGRVGLLESGDAVAFDEVAGLEMSDSTVVNMLKDYMESGSFARGKEETPAEASIVLIGNTSKPHQELVRTAHLFADLPKAMIDPAFIDRLHFYLPGWSHRNLSGGSLRTTTALCPITWPKRFVSSASSRSFRSCDRYPVTRSPWLKLPMERKNVAICGKSVAASRDPRPPVPRQ